MINLYRVPSGQLIGSITRDQLQYLVDQMEETDMEDRDYAITPMLLDFFESNGADADLVSMLREELASSETMLIEWRETAE